MNNIAEQNNKVNPTTAHTKIGDWYRQNERNVLIFCLIFLVVLAVVGYVRLTQLIPEKQPIRFEEIQ